VDDTPKAFLEELRSSLLRRTVGQIALAVVLAEAASRLVSSLTWYLIIPLIGRALRGNTESVLFSGSSARPLPWENLFGSILEFGLVIILVFYLNRWVLRKPAQADPMVEDAEYSSTGEALVIEEHPEANVPLFLTTDYIKILRGDDGGEAQLTPFNPRFPHVMQITAIRDSLR
jgi:large-conductance mechanosensitive channel